MKYGVILCGGYGQRAQHLTVPKPMLTVDGCTVVERLVKQMFEAGLEGVSILTNARDISTYTSLFAQRYSHLTIMAEPHYTEQQKYGSYFGFATHLAYLKGVYSNLESVIAAPGDGLYHTNIFPLLLKRTETAISVIKLPTKMLKNFGLVEFNPWTKNVLGFQEKPESPKSSYAWSGAISLKGVSLANVPAFIQDKWGYLIEILLSKGIPIKIIRIKDFEWVDVGYQEPFTQYVNKHNLQLDLKQKA